MNIYLILFGAPVDMGGPIIPKLKECSNDSKIMALAQNAFLLSTEAAPKHLLKEIKNDLKDNTVYFFPLLTTALWTHNCPDEVKHTIVKTLFGQIEPKVIEF